MPSSQIPVGKSQNFCGQQERFELLHKHEVVVMSLNLDTGKAEVPTVSPLLCPYLTYPTFSCGEASGVMEEKNLP